MASTRTTFTIDEELAQRARDLKVNVSAAAREGVEAAVRTAMARADRDAYLRAPEEPDLFWRYAEAWSEDGEDWTEK